ncbi:ADP-ribosyl-[dinitrogen reductase] glycohydrolase [Posidoniimonas corsicana]|uniref:ADP-ribosyl-[dinitrogen reductase] glycohydrolase n=1 Tax=Posidoniimonas corsicana TaxID=1938618 RepID=A0A5C5VEA6_9BACT|nr:ADP-ribosylglycohydrolase family protein [Posidoniimonas corsicana]TWT35995.1 ADP-ribosyl-[dinitrogen reductase] glycohydrolase [Posidoniimonas corsicana]
MTLYPHILGCLLGTAVGDAVGLRREGLAPRRATKLYGDDLSPALFAGFGVCSDDTEHTVMVARSLAIANHDPEAFERLMASQLKRWLLAAPAGVGLATLRACLKLLVGFGPGRSGVFSAGNGPAMRSALIGVASRSDAQCEEFVRRSTRLTHTDPNAEEGALVVARAAGLTARGKPVDPSGFLGREAERIKGPELRERLAAAHCALVDGLSPAEFAESQGWTNGIGGYVNQTVPAALYCWASSPNEYRQSVTQAVLLGGDTDSVAAITGAIAGANLGDAAIPSEWVAGLTEWPRDVDWIERAAKALAENLAGQRYTNPPPMHWLATLPRNAVFAAIVLGMGFRRLLPPY